MMRKSKNRPIIDRDTAPPALMGEEPENRPIIVIFVTGLTGAGMSTFINSLVQQPYLMPVGNKAKVDSCTKELRDVEIEIKIDGNPIGHRVYIVDTPGFNSTYYASDLDILKKMAAWLKKRWPKQPIDGGVIYLHDIQRDDPSNRHSADLSMLRNSFGQSQETLRRIVLATTKWHSSYDTQKSKERQLHLQGGEWKDLLAGGTSVMKFKKDYASAHDIVQTLLKNCLDTPANFSIQAKLDELIQQVPPDASSHSLLNFLRFFGLFSRRH